MDMRFGMWEVSIGSLKVRTGSWKAVARELE
jgi:hypothetical protein